MQHIPDDTVFFVSVSYCREWWITRHAFHTEAEALAAKAAIDTYACGGVCRRGSAHVIEQMTFGEAKKLRKPRVLGLSLPSSVSNAGPCVQPRSRLHSALSERTTSTGTLQVYRVKGHTLEREE